MASSPTNSILAELCSQYQQAYTALEQDDLGSVKNCIDKAESLATELRGLQSPEAVNQELLQSAKDQHGKLCLAMSQARSQAKGQLERTGQGRKALKGYGNRSTPTSDLGTA